MHAYQPSRLVVASLRAEDVPAVAHFYRDVIGLRLMPGHGQWPAFALENGVHLVIVQGQMSASRDEGAARFPVIALSVPDLDEAVERLQVHGVELPWGGESNQGAEWVMFYDPAGNLIELAQLS